MIDLSWCTDGKRIILKTKHCLRDIKNIKEGPKEKLEKGRKKRR